jgi:predicted CoA-binding protein
MNLQKMAKKLRAVADSIDSLFVDLENETPEVAKKILKAKKKLHWTQKPENKARLRKMLKNAAIKRHNNEQS